MNSIKDLIEAFAQRVRSPIIGYVILMLLIVNWKAFFFLLFSGEPAIDKFAFFDEESNLWTLIGLPLLLGLAAALTTPWINVFGQWSVKRPEMILKTGNIQAAHELAIIRARLKNAENAIVEGLIEAAEQDVRADRIANDEVRLRLQKQIDELRDRQENNLQLSGDARVERLSTIEAEIERLRELASEARHLGRPEDALRFEEWAHELTTKLHNR